MSHYIIKPNPGDEDLYGVFSTNVDMFVASGTWSDVVRFLETCSPSGAGEDPAVAMSIADECGTSSRFPRHGPYPTNVGGWSDDGQVIGNLRTFKGFRWLPRHMFGPFLKAWDEGEDAIAESFTEHWEDDDVPAETQDVDPAALTGGERYLTGRLTAPEYRKAYEDAVAALAVA